jgi:hypothetical protein
MNSQDEGLKASDLGLMIFMLAAIWLWVVLR